MLSCHGIPLSVILPLYKPRGEWSEQFVENINELNQYLSPVIDIEYIVVYDGKPDQSIINKFKEIRGSHPEIKFVHYEKNHGKGYALRYGVSIASAPNILTMDFDFPYQKESIAQMIGLLCQGYDVIVGKRSTEYFKQIPVKRKVISKIFSFLATAFLGLPLRDTQSGMKGFNEKGKQVFLSTTINRFLVDTEFVLRVCKKELNMKTILIELKPGLAFTDFGAKVIRTEMGNFFKLLQLNRSLRKQAI